MTEPIPDDVQAEIDREELPREITDPDGCGAPDGCDDADREKALDEETREALNHSLEKDDGEPTAPTVKDAAKPSADEVPPVQPVAEDVSVSLATPVDVELTRTDNTGDPITFQAPRNMWAMMLKILDETDKLNLDDYQMKLSSVAFKKDGSQVTITMGQGPAKYVMDSVAKQMIPAKAAAGLLFSMVRDLLEPTPIRGVLVTAIFEKQQPVAFAMLNHTLGDQLTPEDINMLAYQGQANVDMFRDKMRKNGHQFPDDNPIIMPSRKLII